MAEIVTGPESGTTGAQASASKSGNSSGNGSAVPVDALVWPSRNLNFGFLPTGITTRGVMDVAVMGAAIMFGIIGFYLLVRPDISKILNKAVSAIGPAAEAAAV